ncbi:MAG: GYDIA family GHMP kinase [Bacteroidales bacterium]
MENTVELYANGKLLLTAEYLVLNGARALAWPVKFGQKLRVTPLNRPIIQWTSEDIYGTWLKVEFSLNEFDLISENIGNSSFARKLLLAARSLNPEFLAGNQGYSYEFHLNYPRNWGLGSSSSLIWLISRLAGVDEFELFYKVSGGSGYDVACASRKLPFFFTMGNPAPVIENTNIGKALQEHCVFAFSGHKQDTQSEVDIFRKYTVSFHSYISEINAIGEAISKENDELKLCGLVKEHEKIMSEILQKPSVSGLYPDFPGAVKSLGAWGGDFIMFAGSYKASRIKEILHGYGLQTLFTFDELSIQA